MFKKTYESRAVNIVFALFIAVLLAVPFSALPAVAQTVAPYIDVSKSASPGEIHVKGFGTPDVTTVTLTLEGKGDPTVGRFNLDVVFAIDSSGSMGWNDSSGLRKTAAKNFIDKLDDTKDRVGVISWDDNIDFTWPSATLSNDFTTAKTKVDAIDASGGTNLNVGLDAAKAMLDGGKRAGASQVVVFLTDGWGSYSSATADALGAAGYVVYTIGLAISPGSTAETRLIDIATRTGGAYYSSPTAANLQAIFDDISTAVLNTAGKNIVVKETLQSHINYEGNAVDPGTGAARPPTSVTTNADGTTTLTWNVGDMIIGDSWEVSFDVSSNLAGTGVAIDVTTGTYDSVVTYLAYDGTTTTLQIPDLSVDVTVPPPLAVAKEASPPVIWQAGSPMSPTESTVTLKVTGPGKNVVVTEVLTMDLNYEGNPSIPPDTVSPDGRTLTWNVGDLGPGAVWMVTFNVSSNLPGTVDVDVLPGPPPATPPFAEVIYTDWEGKEVHVPFPQAQLSVKALMTAEVNVGPAYFPDQTVQVYIMTTVGGRLISGVQIDKITIYYQDDDQHKTIDIDPREVDEVSPGLHKFTYKLPTDAPGGGYKVVVEASYFGVGVAASGIFQVITIPLPWVLPIWAWLAIAVGVLFLLMVIAVRIAR